MGDPGKLVWYVQNNGLMGRLERNNVRQEAGAIGKIKLASSLIKSGDLKNDSAETKHTEKNTKIPAQDKAKTLESYAQSA